MTPDAWARAHHLSRTRIARALGISRRSFDRVCNGDPPTLRHAALFRRLSGGEIGWEDMLPDSWRNTAAHRVRLARRELGLN